MRIDLINSLQQLFNNTVRQHEEEFDRFRRCQDDGDVTGAQQSWDRMKQLGNFAPIIQREIGELMCGGSDPIPAQTA